MTLRWRVALTITSLVALTAIVLSYVFQRAVTDDHRKDHSAWVATLSNALAKAILRDTLEGRQFEVRDTLRRVQKTNPDVAYLMVVGFDGKVFSSTFDGDLPPELARLDHRSCGRGRGFEVHIGPRPTYDTAFPLVEGLDAHLHLGFDSSSFDRSVYLATLKTGSAAAIILLLGFAAAVLVSRRISRPLMQLSEAVDAFGRGEAFDKNHIVHADVEVHKLVDSFDNMARERQQQDKALRQFKTTLDSTRDCVFMFSADDLKFFYVNRGAMDQIGYSEQEMLKMTPYDIKPDFDEASFRQMLAPMLLGKQSFMNFETRHRHRDGHDVPVEIALQYVAPEHEDARFVAIVRDISERKKAQRELRLTRYSFEHASELLIRIGPAGEVLDVNETACQVLGYSREELLRMHSYDFQLGLSKETWPKHWDMVRSRRRYMVEREFRTREGRIIPVEIEVLYLEYEGQAFCYKAARDITERKHAEAALRRLNEELEQRVEQRTEELNASYFKLKETLDTLRQTQQDLVRSEKLASLGSLVAGVAHELNTPLGNSVTVATTLADRVRDFNAEFKSGSVRRSALADFVEFSEKASAILTSSLFSASELISHFKQVAVDQTSEQRRVFDLKEVVSEVTMTLQPQFKKTPYRLEVDLPDDTRMDSFPGPLGQVLTNLVNNALLHGLAERPEGMVSIRAIADEDHVTLTVADTGGGIPQEHLPRIFDPFFTTRLGQGGSGLGLHIVYSIVVRVLGGNITVSSEPGQGTSFTLTLPLAAPASPEADSVTAMAVNQK
jgi:PAS domain S-box-containing protein